MLRLAAIAPLGILLGVVQTCGVEPAPSQQVYRLPNGMNVNADRGPNLVLARPAAAPAAAAAAPVAVRAEPRVAGGCFAKRTPASSASECCSGRVEGGFCVPVAQGCESNADCGAGLACVSGTCCSPSGDCRSGSECCSGSCSSDACVCREQGAACTTAGDCCSLTCENGACACAPAGTACSPANSRACCSGSCVAGACG
ncbi:MAG TPA: hypothetical protein VMB50_05355 [Myxococcales bacterium]|nr:hypothetical protein [Myxococcales bacterium]